MSKAYYELDTMLGAIADKQSSDYDDAYAEGRKDLLEELGIPDPPIEAQA